MQRMCHSVGATVAAALVLMFAATSAQAADHLDKHETRRIVRRLEERTDVLLDRIDDWVAERREEREHRAEELMRAADHFEAMLTQFKTDLPAHEEPWELRDRAKELLFAAGELGRVIDHGPFQAEMRHEWESVRDAANELARHYHLEEIGH